MPVNTGRKKPASLSSVIGDSFEIMKKNPVIIVPYLVLYVLLFIFAIIFFVALFVPLLGHIPLNNTHNFSANFNSTFGINSANKTNSTAAMGAIILNELPALFLIGIIAVVFLLVAAVFLEGMMISFAMQGLKGKISLEEAFGVARNRFWSLLGFTLLYGVIEIIIVTIVIVVLFSVGVFAGTTSTTTSSSGSALQVLAGVGLLIIGVIVVLVILSILFFLGNVLVVVDNLGAIQAFQKSIDYGKKMAGTILVLIILLALINAGFSVVSFILTSVLSFVGSIIEVVLSLFVSSWLAMVPAVFYLEYVKKQSLKK